MVFVDKQEKADFLLKDLMGSSYSCMALHGGEVSSRNYQSIAVIECVLFVCLFVVTPALPRDGGTARTAIQVHIVNPIEIRLGERLQPISNQS